MKLLTIFGYIFLGVVLIAGGFAAGYWYTNSEAPTLKTPFFELATQQETYPLRSYTIPALREQQYPSRTIRIERELSRDAEIVSYLFSYDALGRKMTGQLNFPTIVTDETPVIVLIRGYVPHEIYSTGVGTRNGAAAFTAAGFITIAPDFFGYGESDPEPADSWQARFEKPIAVAELIRSIQQTGIPTDDSGTVFTTQKIGIWGHSNGGQIAMSTLTILKEPIPTTLWAPVVVPFPYSVLYFSDEDADEGKAMRLWVNQLEKKYELREFSFTQYLDGIRGPILLHHGSADEAAPQIWSDEFVAKLIEENERRTTLRAERTASDSALLEPIKYSYHKYPGADHNMQPASNWQRAIERDITFFRKELTSATQN